MIAPQKKILTRRNILRGMFAAPAIIAIDNLMPVKAYSFINPDPNVVLYKGIQGIDSAFVYCPYIPLETEWFAPAALDKLKHVIVYKVYEEPL